MPTEVRTARVFVRRKPKHLLKRCRPTISSKLFMRIAFSTMQLTDIGMNLVIRGRMTAITLGWPVGDIGTRLTILTKPNVTKNESFGLLSHLSIVVCRRGDRGDLFPMQAVGMHQKSHHFDRDSYRTRRGQ